MYNTVFKPGEWVLTGLKENRAFVVRSDKFSTDIIVTSDSKNNPIEPHIIVLPNGETAIKSIETNTFSLDPAPDLPKLFSYDEMDLALSTNPLDVEWCKEIMSRLEVSVDG